MSQIGDIPFLVMNVSELQFSKLKIPSADIQIG